MALDPDTRLRAPIGQVVEAVTEAEAKGVDGINLSAFRYLGGDPEELLAAVSGTVEKPFSIAGSVNSFERIDYLKTLPMLGAFTIGGAFSRTSSAKLCGTDRQGVRLFEELEWQQRQMI